MKITNEISNNGASIKVELESQDKVYPNLVNEAYDASSIILVNTIDTHIYDMGFLFIGLTKLKYLKLQYFCTENVTEMNNMFDGCYSLISLNLSNFDTSNVTDMNYMFFECKKLASLDLSSFNTSKVTDMKEMFGYCRKLNHLDLSSFDTSNVTNMSWMFENCKSLKALDISSFNFTNVKNVIDMFYYCFSLTDLKFGKNLKISIDLSDCPLTHESVLSVIDGLAEVEEQQTLWLNCKNYDQLTDEDISFANSKNWKIFVI